MRVVIASYAFCHCEAMPFVIASVANQSLLLQSTKTIASYGLLRYARNDKRHSLAMTKGIVRTDNAHSLQ